MNFLLRLFLLIIYINKSLEEDKVTFLNIHKKGQTVGDAIVIQSEGQYAMIDVGLRNVTEEPNKISFERIEQFFKKNSIPKLEWILLTHNHHDHVGGIKALLNIVNVGKVYAKNYTAADVSCKVNGKLTDKTTRLKRWNDKIDAIKNKIGENNLYYIKGRNNTEVTLGNYDFKFFNTLQAFKNHSNYCKEKCCNENVNSIVATARNRKHNTYYYFSGDIQTYPPSLAKIIDKKTNKKHKLQFWARKAIKHWTDVTSNEKKNKKFDHFHVYKVSHHGNLEKKKNDDNYVYDKKNNNKKVIELLNPDICVISTFNPKDPLNSMIKGVNKKIEIKYTKDEEVGVIIDDEKDLKNIKNATAKKTTTKKTTTKKASTKKATSKKKSTKKTTKKSSTKKASTKKATTKKATTKKNNTKKNNTKKNNTTNKNNSSKKNNTKKNNTTNKNNSTKKNNTKKNNTTNKNNFTKKNTTPKKKTISKKNNTIKKNTTSKKNNTTKKNNTKKK